MMQALETGAPEGLLWARWLFALTAGIHYLFVATTLGLAPIVAVLSWRNARRPSAAGDGQLKVLGRLYLINYAVGIVTGLVMELQMALVWSGSAAKLWDPIASLLTLETVVAFFLESTLLGLWLVGAEVLGRRTRAAIFTAVAVTAYVSALVVTGANAWLHYPLALAEDRLGLGEVARLLFRPANLTVFGHIAASSLTVGSCWALAAGARVMQHGGDAEVATRLFRTGAITLAWSSVVSIVVGGAQFPFVRPVMVTNGGIHAVYLSLMMLIGLGLPMVCAVGLLPLALRGRLVRPKVGKLWWTPLSWLVSLPLAATFFGWLYREESRQPWFIFQRVTLAQAMNPLPAMQVALMLVVFVGLSSAAAGLCWVLMHRSMRCPVQPEPDGREPELDPVKFDHAGGWV